MTSLAGYWATSSIQWTLRCLLCTICRKAWTQTLTQAASKGQGMKSTGQPLQSMRWMKHWTIRQHLMRHPQLWTMKAVNLSLYRLTLYPLTRLLKILTLYRCQFSQTHPLTLLKSLSTGKLTDWKYSQVQVLTVSGRKCRVRTVCWSSWAAHRTLLQDRRTTQTCSRLNHFRIWTGWRSGLTMCGDGFSRLKTTL